MNIKGGEYQLYDNFKILFNGIKYDYSKELPKNTKITILNNITNNNIVLNDSFNHTQTVGNNSRCSIGFVKINQPCSIKITVSGLSEPRVFSLIKSKGKSLFIGIGIALVINTFGVILAIIGLVQLIPSIINKLKSKS